MFTIDGIKEVHFWTVLSSGDILEVERDKGKEGERSVLNLHIGHT